MVSSSCSKCGRMAYASDSVQIDDRLIHKRCFKCQTCGKSLTLSNFGVYRGSVYCKRHLAMLSGQKLFNKERDLRAASVAYTATSAAAAAQPKVVTAATASAAAATTRGRGHHRRTSITSNASLGTRTAAASVMSPSPGGKIGGHSHSQSVASLPPSGTSREAAARLRSPSTIIRSRTNVCVICSKPAYPTESIKVDTLWYHKRCFKCEHCKCRLTMGGFAMINTNAYCKPHFKQLFQSSGGKYDRAFGSIWGNSSDPKARSNTVIRKSYVPPVETVFNVTGVNSKTFPAGISRSKTPQPTSSSTRVNAVSASPQKALPSQPKAATKLAVPTTKLTPKPPTSQKPKLKVVAPTPVSTTGAEIETLLSAARRRLRPASADPRARCHQSPAAPVSTTPKKAAPTQPQTVVKETGPVKQLPPAPTVKAPATPTAKVTAKPSTPVTPKMNGEEDPVAAFFRALKSNNPKSLAVALTALEEKKKLGVLVTPAAQLTQMTPVEYAYVTRKIPVARTLVLALKEHFDSA